MNDKVLYSFVRVVVVVVVARKFSFGALSKYLFGHARHTLGGRPVLREQLDKLQLWACRV